MIVTIGNSKGGVGKSTITAHLAVAAALRGIKTLIVDSDSQGSSMTWRAQREKDYPEAYSITTPTIHQAASKIQGYDLILIDAGGRDGACFRSAVAAANALIIPMLPSPYDVWGTEDTINILREVRAVGREIEARVLFNQIRNTVLSREAIEALADYSDDVQPLKAQLHYHEFLKKAPAAGQGIGEYRPGSAPAKEIEAVLDEILTIGGRG
ncbi:AAA family ATPase [Trichlorobacter lovleyi]|uniref:AAA family ATPase n=1 Tax=Trichlorobacter lovleyi TaxID=313985 RepID=UPI0024809194|nr:AAA family ATPase [Trichlorobacter lovleyi]